MAAMLEQEFGGAPTEAHEVQHTLEVQTPFVPGRHRHRAVVAGAMIRGRGGAQ